MSQETVETLRRAADAFSRGAWDEAQLEFDTTGRWPPAESGSEGSSYFGFEAIRNYLQSWFDNFDDLRLEIVELVDAGEKLFAVVQVSGKGRQSGEDTSSPPHPLVVRFEGGKILGLIMFMSPDAARQAAGLLERDAARSNPLP